MSEHVPKFVAGIDVGTATAYVAIGKTDSEGERSVEIVHTSFDTMEMGGKSSVALYEKLRESAEAGLGNEVGSSVLAFPFSEHGEKEGQVAAANEAGLKVHRSCQDLSLVVSAYQLDDDMDEVNALVLDCGASGARFCVYTIDCGITETMAQAEAEAPGHMFTNRILNHLAQTFVGKTGKTVMASAEGMGKLKEAAEAAKRSLSTQDEVTVEVADVMDGAGLSEVVSQAKLAELCGRELEAMREALAKVVSQSGVAKDAIQQILPSGGSCNLPMIREMVTGFLEGATFRTDIKPEEACALGAARRALKLSLQ